MIGGGGLGTRTVKKFCESNSVSKCWEPKLSADLDPFRFNPANYVHKWSTPQLLIHGSKDYRLPETEGIGAFHALQQ